MRYRITPACAGNSAFTSESFGGYRDHPRVCGEQAIWKRGRCTYIGSPPRVRGTARCFAKSWDWTRITPACAGNSPSIAPSENTVRDHPRVCGEQLLYYHGIGDIKGSPPRVRGTEFAHVFRVNVYGITPACAGNSMPVQK